MEAVHVSEMQIEACQYFLLLLQISGAPRVIAASSAGENLVGSSCN